MYKNVHSGKYVITTYHTFEWGMFNTTKIKYIKKGIRIEDRCWYFNIINFGIFQCMLII